MVASLADITSCIWGGPEGKGPGCQAKRPKFSLLTHIQVHFVGFFFIVINMI